jgi:ribosome-binding protein aMBF1 (putative translation factor)
MISTVAFTMERFREVLRAERESRVGGREKLADKTGINKTTIQNAEVGPDIPGIDTVARLVEGNRD